MTKEVAIVGMKQLKRSLEGLPKKISKNLRFTAMIRAARPMQTAAREFAPKREHGGTLRKSISFMRNMGAIDREPTVLLGPTQGPSAKYDAWYAQFHEHGTKGFGKRRKLETWDSGLAKTAALNSQMSVYQRTVGKGAGRYIIVTGYQRKGSGLPAVRFMQRAFEQKVGEYHKNVKKELSNVVTTYLRQTVPNAH